MEKGFSERPTHSHTTKSAWSLSHNMSFTVQPNRNVFTQKYTYLRLSRQLFYEKCNSQKMQIFFPFFLKENI